MAVLVLKKMSRESKTSVMHNFYLACACNACGECNVFTVSALPSVHGGGGGGGGWGWVGSKIKKNAQNDMGSPKMGGGGVLSSNFVHQMCHRGGGTEDPSPSW